MKMKIGDTVKMSKKNRNHLGYNVSAYAGMTGVVTAVWEDNAFVLDCGTSILVVPMQNAWKHYIDGVWVYLNNVLIQIKPNKI